MPDEFDDEPKSTSLLSLISWLSLCLLSASLGRFMPATLQTVWGYVGLFGLAAGLGLGAVQQSCKAQKERTQRMVVQRQLVQKLEKYVPHITATPKELTPVRTEGVR